MHRVYNPSQAVHMEHADALYGEYRKARAHFNAAYDTGEFDSIEVINMIVLLAMLRNELRNLDGNYAVGPLNEDLEDITAHYKALKLYAKENMERAVPPETFQFLKDEEYATGWTPPPGFAMWKKSRDKSRRRSRRAPRRSVEEREMMEEYLETGDEELAEEFRETVRVSPDARRYAARDVEIRPGRAARRGAAKRLAQMQMLAQELRDQGAMPEYVEAQQRIAELMAHYDISEDEVRAYRDELSP